MIEFDITFRNLSVATSFVLSTIPTIITLICIYTFSTVSYSVLEWILMLIGCMCLYFICCFSICIMSFCISNCVVNLFFNDTNETEVVSEPNIIVECTTPYSTIDNKDNLPPSYSAIFN